MLFVFGSLMCGLTLSSFGLMSAKAASNQPPGGGMGGPRGMSEAVRAASLAACEDASVDDECSFSADDKDVEGTCKTNPRDEELVCRPEGGRGKTQGQGMSQGQKGGQVGDRGEVKTKVTQRQRVGNIEQRKVRQEANAARVVNRIEKVIAYLETKEIDTTDIKSQLAVFEGKTTDLTAAYAAYSELDKESDEVDEDTISAARENIKTLAKASKSYFLETLKVSIQNALLELT